MKVLWLSPIELPAVSAALGKSAGRGGGWIDGLRASLLGHPDLTLHIACVTGNRFEPFVYESVTYHPLRDSMLATRAGRAVRRASLSERTAGREEQCREIVRCIAPDIIHVHGTETALASAALATGVPTLVSLQGIVGDVVRHYFDGVSSMDVILDSLKVSSMLRGVGLVPGYLSLKRAVASETRVIHSASFFTGRTDYDRSAVSSLNPDATYYHCDRVLRPEFYAASTRRPVTEPRLLCVGSAAPYKGIEVVLQAAARLTQLGYSNLRLRVAGPLQGSPMWPILLRKARHYGVVDQVDWLGRLAPAQLIDELSACSAFVYASHVDNSPNALAEAMMCGAPVVSVATGGIPSMVCHGVDGLLVPVGDLAGLCESVDRVLKSPDLQRALGEAARSRALLRHDSSSVGAATIESYSDILSRHEAAEEL